MSVDCVDSLTQETQYDRHTFRAFPRKCKLAMSRHGCNCQATKQHQMISHFRNAISIEEMRFLN
eukprot:5742845-Amphidinium_carterae.1